MISKVIIRLLTIWMMLGLTGNLTAQSARDEIEKPVKIEYQGKSGYFVTRAFVEDYLSLVYEVEKQTELLTIKDSLYKSLYADYQSFAKSQQRDKIISSAWRITAEVLGVSFLGVTAGFIVYALVVR